MSRTQRIRVVITATALSAATLLATVASALAGGGNGPFPK